MKSILFRLLVASMLSLTVSALAAPGVMNYQGRLTNPSGQPITTAVNVNFTFWSAATGGTQLGSGFNQTNTVTPDASGIYSTLIGSDPGNLIPASIFSEDSVWLNVRINGEHLVPRKRVASVGYALSDKWVNTTGDTMTGPLTITGSSSPALVNVTNNNTGSVKAIQGTASGTSAFNYGGYFEAAGSAGRGVYAVASATGNVTNNGGEFSTSGNSGAGVLGSATATGAVTNFGGIFDAAGGNGRGVSGYANGVGDYLNYGGYFIARGNSGRGVYGSARATGAVANVGGSFDASGDNCRGVDATAGGTSGYGVHGDASGISGVGVYGEATSSSGNTYGIRGKVSSSSGYAGYFEGRGYFSDKVGIGKTNPASRLHVEGSDADDVLLVTNTGSGRGATITAQSDTALWALTTSGIAGVDARNAGPGGRGVSGAATYTQAGISHGGYFTAASSAGRGIEAISYGPVGIAVRGEATSGGPASNYGGYFTAASDSGIGVRASGNGYDFYAAGTGTNYGAFTGGHEVQFDAAFPASPKTGMIVVTTGPSKTRHDEAGEVSISSTLPTVGLADRPNAKAVFGVLVKEQPLPEDHWYKHGSDERFGIVNALGEGRVWVCSAAGPIEMGDYITTSAVPGYGQKQKDDLQHSYTVGKVIESVDWDTVTETIEHNGKVYKMYLIAVVYTCG